MAAQALILGATGSMGGAVAAELLRRGVTVAALARNEAKAAARFASARDRLTVVGGSAERPEDVARALQACGPRPWIVAAAGPPWWSGDPALERIVQAVLAAAARQGGTVLLPTTAHGLKAADEPLREDAPPGPTTAVGRLRVKVERMVREAVEGSDGRLRGVVLRTPPCFGPTVRGTLVDPLFQCALAERPVALLGDPAARAPLGYAPDVARAAAGLMQAAGRMQAMEVLHLPGLVPESRMAFARLVAEHGGHGGLSITRLPRWAARLLGLRRPDLRAVLELGPRPEGPLLDGRGLRRLLPGLEATELELAVDETFMAYRREAAAA